MLELDGALFIVAIPAAIFVGISKGGFGSGAAFASSSILALVLTPGQALAIMLPLLMPIDVATLRPYWRKWSWPDARLLILGDLPGVALGVCLYRSVEPDVFRQLIGGISVGFVLWQLARARGLVRPAARSLPPWAGAVAGAVAGFTSFVSHAGGPPPAVHLLSRKLDKTRHQDTTVLLFWAINIAKAVPYAFLGMLTVQTARAGLILAPFALIGAWIGGCADRIMPEHAFFAVTYLLLTATGAKLIWDGLT